MRISNFEKGMLIGVVVCLVVVAVLLDQMRTAVSEAGGLRAIVVEVGKEVKDIAKDINEE